MELLPKNADILPPSDDRVFKLILAPDESKPILIDLLSSVLQRHVVDVVVRNSEIPPETRFLQIAAKTRLRQFSGPIHPIKSLFLRISKAAALFKN